MFTSWRVLVVSLCALVQIIFAAPAHACCEKLLRAIEMSAFDQVLRYALQKDPLIRQCKDSDGGNVMHHFARHSEELSIFTVLKYNLGADLNATNSLGETPLMIAARFNKVRAIEMLAYTSYPRANMRAQDILGNTALHHAAVENNKEAVQALIYLGVPCDTLNSEGKTFETLLFHNVLEPKPVPCEDGDDRDLLFVAEWTIN